MESGNGKRFVSRCTREPVSNMRRSIFLAFVLVISATLISETQGLNISQPSPINVFQLGGSAVSTAASGVQKVGITGNAGAVVDAATNAAAPANVLWDVDSPSTAAGVALSSSTKTANTSSVNVKASAGNLYGVIALSGVSTTCWLQFINSASAGTLGTAVILSIPLPASTTQPLWITPGSLALANFSSGIAVGTSTTATGSTACGTGSTVDVFFH